MLPKRTDVDIIPCCPAPNSGLQQCKERTLTVIVVNSTRAAKSRYLDYSFSIAAISIR